ncbi:oxidative stress defense protein [Candidatus Rickettsiella viridis]|uniref:Oxidative stress defense protein n=1 Tax=Candidatus Rickettsiella viridis TaxID=676208 RepID=A0A2Z5UVR4_9COXI|nr:oxidative stress defense protein [Candidatus Rickettsiella viridis]
MPLTLPAKAGELPEGPHIVTSGTSSVEATPNMATISIEVSVSANNAAEAKKQVDLRVAQYFDFLRQNDIEKKDINAANLNTQPEYDYPKTGQAVLKGYRAVRQVQVTVRQIDKLNPLLDGALKLGLNEINAIKFGVANPSIYRQQARQKAIENAISVADSLAEGFKVKRGPIYSIRYSVANDQARHIVLMYKSSEANSAKTYEQETIHFDDQVDVVFELENPKQQMMNHSHRWSSHLGCG